MQGEYKKKLRKFSNDFQMTTCLFSSIISPNSFFLLNKTFGAFRACAVPRDAYRPQTRPLPPAQVHTTIGGVFSLLFFFGYGHENIRVVDSVRG